MRQSLQLRLGQQLTMTPQLQQAIRLLQLSSLDLQVEVQAILDSNLMLERADEPQDLPVQPETLAAQAAAESSSETEIGAAGDTLPDELPVDSAWEDIYEPYDGATRYSRGEEEDWDPYERYAGAGESLRDYLYWQMRLTPFDDRELAIATAIIDAIGDSGYLTLSLEEICQGLRDEFLVTPAEAESVLVHDAPVDGSASALSQVRRIVADELAAFGAARRSASVTPTLVALRSMATAVVEAELERLRHRLPHLDAKSVDEVSHAIRRVAEKLLHQPTVRVKELAKEPGTLSYATALAELFALDPDAVDAVTTPLTEEGGLR